MNNPCYSLHKLLDPPTERRFSSSAECVGGSRRETQSAVSHDEPPSAEIQVRPIWHHSQHAHTCCCRLNLVN